MPGVMVAPGIYFNNMSNNKKEETEPVKKQIKVVRQTTHYFPTSTNYQNIDKTVNDWMVEKHKANMNPIIQERKVIDEGLFVFTLHTEIIDID